jgi:murein DD-endopeptidase MepM/ murein hydrolase activator NlpD
LLNQQYEVNKSARKARHQRVFSGAAILDLPKEAGIVSRSLIEKSIQIKSVFSPYLPKQKPNDSHSAINSLFKKYTAMVVLIFMAGSINPIGTSAEVYGNQFIPFVDESLFESGILADNEGYLTKINPQTIQGDRSDLSDKHTHTVESGETLSTIAGVYGLKTQTLMWENNLANANSIRVGQKLVIPPVDGISHTVSKGETIDKIAKEYNVDVEIVKKQNNLLATNIESGQDIFIPGAKPKAPEIVRTTPARVSTATRVNVGTPVALSGNNETPVGGKPLLFPTRGKITQGYHKGHYAVDIADTSMPPVWSAATGKVTKAASGDWGGGYGNHVIIDHGNGLQTLYAHLDYLTVKVGDTVDQGQVIGRMGRTGRVYGRTGIHLHFEVIKNGVKQVPSNYY